MYAFLLVLCAVLGINISVFGSTAAAEKTPEQIEQELRSDSFLELFALPGDSAEMLERNIKEIKTLLSEARSKVPNFNINTFLVDVPANSYRDTYGISKQTLLVKAVAEANLSLVKCLVEDLGADVDCRVVNDESVIFNAILSKKGAFNTLFGAMVPVFKYLCKKSKNPHKLLLHIGKSGSHFIVVCFALNSKRITRVGDVDTSLYQSFVELYQEYGIELIADSVFFKKSLEDCNDFFKKANLALQEGSHSHSSGKSLIPGGNGASPAAPGAEQKSTSSSGHIIATSAAAVGGGLVGGLIVKNLLGRILARRKQELFLGRKQALAEGKSTEAIDRELALLSSNTLSFKDKAMIAASAVLAAAVVGGGVYYAGASHTQK